jgi:putative ABC transport system substrate-binding protein
MRRRDFVKGIAGSVIGWPLTARAQHPAMPVVGFLHARAPEDTVALVAAFRSGLSDNGFVEGSTVSIEYRWGRGQYDRIPGLVAELVHLPVNLLVTGAEPAALAAKAATSSIPIVFSVGSDPVKLGLVASFNEPGGNATGMDILTTSLDAKRLGLLHQVMPHSETIGVLVNPKFAAVAESQLSELQTAADDAGLRTRAFRASSVEEIDAAFQMISREQLAALVITADPFFDTRRDQIAALAASHAVAVVSQFRDQAIAGGLMSYGIDLPDAYRQVGVYAAQILKGAKPADLPVLQPTKFELVINLKTARLLRIEVPSGVLSIADEVIE